MDKPLLKQTGRGAMRLQMSGVDHQPFRHVSLGRQGHDDVAEHAKAAPADKLIVERLRQAVAAWRILPLGRVPGGGVGGRGSACRRDC